MNNRRPFWSGGSKTNYRLPVNLCAQTHSGDVCAVVFVEAATRRIATVTDMRLRDVEPEHCIVGQQPVQAYEPGLLLAAFVAAVDCSHGGSLVAKIEHIVAASDLPGSPPAAAATHRILDLSASECAPGSVLVPCLAG